MKIEKDYHLWGIVGLLLVGYFSLRGTSVIQTFYFVTFLMPVAIGTSHYFNQHLLPKYLLTEKYGLFVLYLCYTIIISLYAEILILFLSLLLFSYFQVGSNNILTLDIISLSLGLYLMVMINAFFQIFKAFRQKEAEIGVLEAQKVANQLEKIVVRVNRKQHQILLQDLCYIESLGDYVKIITEKEQLVTKEKISALNERLPDYFIRIHRSFLVNQHKVSSFNKEQLLIKEQHLPISRTYKKRVIERLSV